MSLAAVVQHVQVLEACGVVKTEKVGRTRICRIEPEAMTAAEQWSPIDAWAGKHAWTDWATF